MTTGSLSAAHLTGLTTALADRYRLERELGAGGMATVWLAEDVRHGRRIAIKVLRPELSAVLGPDRFLAEIRTTANLQHPHILPLFDSGAADGLLYYVMPFVPGETLRARLDRERQLPVTDAVRIASEVADALDYAHRHGVVHRDVKPENILLHDGHVVVADFGIALAVQQAGGERMTQTGLSLGTPQYMAPEQAMGERTVDARADVYALGAVTYEMLAGEPPFMGPTMQAIVARAMTEVPRSLTAQRPSVPAHVDSAVRRALERLPADRMASAAAFAAALAGTADVAWSPARARAADVAAAGAGRRLVRGAGLAAALVAASALGAAAAWRLGSDDRAPPAVARALIPLARGQLLSAGYSSLDLSPDGTQLVYVGDESGRRNLFLRPLADSVAHLVPGTEGATEPFFSPDGAWIGFVANRQLLKVPRAGGPPIAIAAVPYVPLGVSWGDDDTILYALGDSLLYRVSSDGRAPPRRLRISTADGARTLSGLRFPSFLPGGREALVSTDSGVGVVDLARGDVRSLFRGRQARYLPTGHLLYDDDEGRIRVVGFDLRARRVVGTPAPAFEAFRASGDGASFYAVSATGTLVYLPGGFRRSLVWVDRNGREAPLALEPRGYRFPRVSPDGRLVAVTIDPRPSSVWVIDPVRGSAAALTPVGTHAFSPRWSPDGRRILVIMTGCFCALPIDGGDPVPVLAQGAQRRVGNVGVQVWLPGDRFVGITTGVRSWQAPRDIMTFGLGDTVPRPLIATPADDRDPWPSPDGRWLAYASSVTGTLEVYVRPFTAPGPSVRVSTGGGLEPRWSRSGAELFYRSGASIVVARVAATGADFRVAGAPETLFTGTYDFTQDNNWDVAPDGRFLMVRGDPTSGTHLHAVFNWFDEVRALAPR